MSTIRVRRLDDSWDPAWGSGLNDYLEDIDAVAQIIRSRLLLFKGEWWEDLNLGIPMWQSILGTMGSNKPVVDRLIAKTVKETPYVTSIQSFVSTLVNREYNCSITVNTEFGTVTVTNGG